MTHVPFIEDAPTIYTAGLLGATGESAHAASANRLTMIERRILQIEEALRKAAIAQTQDGDNQ